MDFFRINYLLAPITNTNVFVEAATGSYVNTLIAVLPLWPKRACARDVHEWRAAHL